MGGAMKRIEKRKEQLFIFELLLPGLILIGFFIVFPLYKVFQMSFTNWDLMRAADGYYFLGWQNFKDLFALSHFTKTIKLTILFEFGCVVGTIVFSMVCALALNTNFPGRAFVRGIALLPWAIPSFVIAKIFLLSFNGDYGMFARMFQFLFNVDTNAFFSNEKLAFGLVSFLTIWKSFPFVTVLLMAAFSTVPKDYYEAAELDGAGRIRQLFSITIPSIMPTLATLTVMQFMSTLRTFDMVYLFTQGGPNYGTNIIGNDIYLNGFKLFKFGMASAEGVILFIVSMLFVIPYFIHEGKED